VRVNGQNLDGWDAGGLNSGTGHHCEGEREGGHEARGGQ
jgi:hypothetical protein